MLSVPGFGETRQALSREKPAPSPDTTIPPYVGRYVHVAETKSDPGTERYRSRIDAYEFFTPHSADVLWVVPVDIDQSDALPEVLWAVAEERIPTPSWIVHNQATGHCQVAWIVETIYAPGARGDYAPNQLFCDLWAILTHVLRGDQHFSRHRMRNPWHTGADVLWGVTEPRRMADLIREVKLGGASRPSWSRRSPQPARGTVASGEALEKGRRNRGVFDALRYRAYALAREGNYAVEVLAAAAEVENGRCSEPLADSELRRIVSSIDKFIARRYRPGGGGTRRPGGGGPSPAPGFSARQAFLGRRGGLRRTEKQRRALADGNRARQTEKARRDHAIIDLAEAEPHLTRLEIQERLGESRTRVQTVLRADRITPKRTSPALDRTEQVQSCPGRTIVHRAAGRRGLVVVGCHAATRTVASMVVRVSPCRARLRHRFNASSRRQADRGRHDLISHQIKSRAGPKRATRCATRNTCAPMLAVVTP